MPASLSRGTPAKVAGDFTVADRTDNFAGREIPTARDHPALSQPPVGGRTRSFPSPRPAHAAGRAASVSADDEGTNPTGWARAASPTPTPSNIDSIMPPVKAVNEYMFEDRVRRGAGDDGGAPSDSVARGPSGWGASA
ncbi:hypothetical protein Mro03_08980 [Microbispora rosea subsp. rosea]|nr:hypothetical protein Mro03_08980 [Microbispora rosea subsp. rosea]